MQQDGDCLLVGYKIMHLRDCPVGVYQLEPSFG